MSIASAERNSNKGLAALADGKPLQAADFLVDAMRIERLFGVRHPDMRSLSYYGLSLARAHGLWQAATPVLGLRARGARLRTPAGARETT